MVSRGAHSPKRSGRTGHRHGWRGIPDKIGSTGASRLYRSRVSTLPNGRECTGRRKEERPVAAFCGRSGEQNRKGGSWKDDRDSILVRTARVSGGAAQCSAFDGDRFFQTLSGQLRDRRRSAKAHSYCNRHAPLAFQEVAQKDYCARAFQEVAQKNHCGTIGLQVYNNFGIRH